MGPIHPVWGANISFCSPDLQACFPARQRRKARRLRDERRNDGVTVTVDHGIKEASTLVTIKMRIKHAETNVTDEMTETRFPEIRSAEDLRVKQIKNPTAEAVPERDTSKSVNQGKKSKANRIAINIGADGQIGMIPAKFIVNQSDRTRTTTRRLTESLVQLRDAEERSDREIPVSVNADHAHRRRQLRLALRRTSTPQLQLELANSQRTRKARPPLNIK